MEVALPVIRLEANEECGLAMEAVTRTEYEINIYNAICGALSLLIENDDVKQTKVRLTEIDRVVMVDAIINKRIARDFALHCATVNRYVYSPYGPGAFGFGYDSPSTLAWIVIHEKLPALLFRSNDNASVEAVNQWIDYIASVDVWPAFPKKPEHMITISPPRTDIPPLRNMIKQRYRPMKRNRRLRI
jgi:hypothetical protein